MRGFYLSSCLLLALTFLSPSVTANELAVGVVINGGDLSDDLGRCDAGDVQIVKTVLDEIMTDIAAKTNRRSLIRASRRQLTSNCNFLCAGFPPGTCYYAYPWCPNRRQLVDERRELTMPETVREKLEANMAIAGAHELVSDATHTPEKRLKKECMISKKVILKEMNKVKVSPGCRGFLRSQVDVMCIEVPTN